MSECPRCRYRPEVPRDLPAEAMMRCPRCGTRGRFILVRAERTGQLSGASGIGAKPLAPPRPPAAVECGECGGNVSAERLRAAPGTRLCARCAALAEAAGHGRGTGTGWSDASEGPTATRSFRRPARGG